MADDLIKISATGVAEFITANPSSRPSKLRPYKFNKRGEGLLSISAAWYAILDSFGGGKELVE